MALLCHQFGGHRLREPPRSWPLAPGFTWPWAPPPPQQGPLDLSVAQAGASPLTASVLGEGGRSILFLKLKKYYFIITAFTKTNVECAKTLHVPTSPLLGLAPCETTSQSSLRSSLLSFVFFHLLILSYLTGQPCCKLAQNLVEVPRGAHILACRTCDCHLSGAQWLAGGVK